MISRVVLGNGSELTNIDTVTETVRTISPSLVTKTLAISIRIGGNRVPSTMQEVIEIFQAEGALSRIQVYKKDLLRYEFDEELQQEVPVYSDEYLALDTTEYATITDISQDIYADRVHVSLAAAPTSIADYKYQELKQETLTLMQALAELTMLIPTLLPQGTTSETGSGTEEPSDTTEGGEPTTEEPGTTEAESGGGEEEAGGGGSSGEGGGSE